jgi:putative ABC transport system permease protein
LGLPATGCSCRTVEIDVAVTPDLLIDGLKAALIIGIVGGFFPALRAARLPVAQALREL